MQDGQRDHDQTKWAEAPFPDAKTAKVSSQRLRRLCLLGIDPPVAVQKCQERSTTDTRPDVVRSTNRRYLQSTLPPSHQGRSPKLSPESLNLSEALKTHDSYTQPKNDDNRSPKSSIPTRNRNRTVPLASFDKWITKYPRVTRRAWAPQETAAQLPCLQAAS